MNDAAAPSLDLALPPLPVETVDAPRAVKRAWGDRLTWLLLAALAYVPLLASKPGMVAADTKQYLYLDPGRLIQGAASMWDPSVGMGTVTHQNIGYLFPMGPFYWVFHQLGVPTWIAQRLWMGSILFAAGLGVYFLGRLLGLRGAGLTVAALAYMLSPYIIDYISRISAILLPWAGLGWMIGLVVLALRRGGWRYPALFALVVAVVGGVNATSLLYAGLAPVLVIPYMVWVTRETTWRRAGRATACIGVLTVAVSLWWAAGLWAQGSYGLNVLKYTETVPTVASTSLASEVVRGLGYWYFYGQDKIQAWTLASTGYTQWLWLIALSFALPLLAVVFGSLVRWRYRAYFVGLVLLGLILAVGTYPYAHPSPLGSVLKAASVGSTVGLAMRSSNRAVPLIALGLAMLLGSGLAALTARWPWQGLAVTGLCGAMVLANLPPLWTGDLIAANLVRPEKLPSYWYQATSYLNRQSHATRVLELPGEDFAAYRWGVTEDPVAIGLMSRATVIRQVVPYGEAGSVNLLNAFDETLPGGVFERSTLGPIARLMSSGEVLLESDQQYERFNTPRPRPMWALLNPPPPGLSAPVGFGTPSPTQPIKYPLIDETALAQTPGAYPPPLATFKVVNARPIVRSETSQEPLLVAGDGAGLVDAAAAGLLAHDPTILYAASLTDPAQFAQAMANGADLVLTDTNQRQGLRWGSLRENTGYVEQAGEKPLVPDPSNAALDVFPGSSDATKTVAELNGVASVQASAYGNPITYTPEDRPSNALDSNPHTAWTVGAFSSAIGEHLNIGLDHPVTTDHINLLQPQNGPRNRHITKATVLFDGRNPMPITLGASSLSGFGQVVNFSSRSFSHLEIVINDTSAGHRNSYDGFSGVGFAEVGIPGVNLHEVLRLPTDLLSQAGASSISHRLTILMTRLRAPSVPPRSDPELDIARTFSLPTARTFAVGGTARISARDSDALINQLLGFGISDTNGVGANPGGTSSRLSGAGSAQAVVVGADSSSRLPGDLRASADATVDSNPNTAWVPGLGPQAGNWLKYDLSRTVSFNHLNLAVLADGQHSVPTRITISTESGSATVDVPAVTDAKTPGTVAAAPVNFPTLTGRHIKVTIDGVRPVTTLDYYSDRRITLPVGVAEIGLPGVATRALPASIPALCRSDLLSIDGSPIDISVSGSSTQALDNGSLGGGGLAITGCGNSAHGITLSAGSHVLRTSLRLPSGIQVDRIALSSKRGGGALSTRPNGQVPTNPVAAAPAVTVTHQDSTHVTAHVAGNGQGFWMVLGQSQNRGWQASLSGRSLGPSQLIDGYANGWYVPPGTINGPATIQIRWAPQRVIWAALVASAAALVLSVILAFLPERVEGGAFEVATVGDDEGAGPDTKGRYLHRRRRWAGRASEPRTPVLESWWHRTGSDPAWPASLGLALGAGLVAGLITAPAGGLLVAVAVFLALVVRRARFLLSAASVSLLAAAGVYMVVSQASHDFVPAIEWPGNFGLASSLVWLSICFLAAEALVVLVRRIDLPMPIDEPARRDHPAPVDESGQADE
ncbi:MAG: alpha-(1-_3)-arabinofuranosyltransferase domain-containing protein [Acidimicrobiales bacterium]